MGAYASLFANVDVPYFLSIATEAPIYTEGLSAALQTALASYSESASVGTVTTMTTRTYTTVNTIVTNFVNGTVTVPTTIVSTETVVTVEPVGQVQVTSTALQAAPAPTANAPVNKVTTEVVTLGNGRVGAELSLSASTVTLLSPIYQKTSCCPDCHYQTKRRRLHSGPERCHLHSHHRDPDQRPAARRSLPWVLVSWVVQLCCCKLAVQSNSDTSMPPFLFVTVL